MLNLCAQEHAHDIETFSLLQCMQSHTKSVEAKDGIIISDRRGICARN